MGRKFWEFKNLVGDSADLNIYREISDNDWWGDSVTPQQFQKDLAAVGAVANLNIHINSLGGGVFAGHTISNLLRAHPANKTVYVDGIAASIASVIAMAGDKVVMQPGSMLMVHNPLNVIYGAYSAEEMRGMADTLDKIRDSLVSVYEAKCGKSPEDIIEIMAAETWYTAAEAVEQGFADEVGTGAVACANMSGSVLNIAGRSFDLAGCKNLPKSLCTGSAGSTPDAGSTQDAGSTPVTGGASATGSAGKSATPNKDKEDNILDIKELQAKYPDLYKAAVAQGVAQERQRMQAIDEVSMPGHEDLIAKARYETGESAEALAVALVKAEKGAQAKNLQNLQDDAKDSNVNGVPGAAAPGGNDEASEIKAAAKAMADAANKGRD